MLAIEHRVVPSDVDESRYSGEGAGEHAGRLAVAKMAAVAAAAAYGEVRPWVLGADTVVVIDGDVLGKPVDDADAEVMLGRLSGRLHEVITAVALGRAGQDPTAALLRTVTSRVRFRVLSRAEIQRYVASGEGRDKAGGYAAQGLGAGLVAEVDGSWTNVVGLPAAQTIELLSRASALIEWP